MGRRNDDTSGSLGDTAPGAVPEADDSVAGIDAVEDVEGAGGAASEARPSRSARKRHAIALQKLGVRLIHLKSAQLHSLALPEELLAAVLEAQRLRSRPALSRQQQYIGRLMRQIDPEPIEQALDATLHR
jgi:ribosomal 50S subunit-associated protein YjgA (DUF615 family)